MKRLLLPLALIPLFCFSLRAQAQTVREGDIIFHTSKSSQSKAIRIATKSKYSHMGIIFYKNGELNVLEAVQPVKYTSFDEWTSRGEGGHYVIKRIQNAQDVLNVDTLEKMKKEGESFLGKNYDLYFEWSDERIYCSELVWKIYKRALDMEIGELSELGSFDLSEKAVKDKLKERYGDSIPLKEKVISPADMFKSKKLIKVIEK